MLLQKAFLTAFVVFIFGCQATADVAIDERNPNLTSGVVLFDDDIDDPNCPVGLVNGLTLDEEFGPGTSEITRCLKSKRIKVLYQINAACGNAECTKPYSLGNIQNAINDYEITHGLTLGVNFDIVAVAYGAGYRLMTANDALEPFAEENPFQSQVESLLTQGVKFYFCQNTSRSKGIVTANLIPGIKYVTSGVTAITDFQLLGYAHIQP